MRHDTITRRRTTRSHHRRSQPRSLLTGLAGHILPGLRVAWRAFWQGVEHPRLVQGAVQLPLTLALLVVLAHLLLPRAASPETPGQRQPSLTPQPVLSIAERVPVISQGNPAAGWDSRAQFDRWWDSACAPAALTMDLRAWGAQVRIGQVLDRLIALHAITIQQGLLHAEALASVAKGYGFQAITFWRWTLSNIAYVTRQGVPVLIDVVDAKRQTPYPALSVGHWLVVTSVSATQVEVRDSSAYHIHDLSLALFHTLSTGISVVVWQGALALPQEG